ncbi:unnamed protein product, partial [Iphiclides podalirius]
MLYAICSAAVSQGDRLKRIAPPPFIVGGGKEKTESRAGAERARSVRFRTDSAIRVQSLYEFKAWRCARAPRRELQRAHGRAHAHSRARE